MTDYELLYSKFQLNVDDSKRLNELHRLSHACQSHIERIVVTTFVTDTTGKEFNKKEVHDAKLV